jgi:hypothetical protein
LFKSFYYYKHITSVQNKFISIQHVIDVNKNITHKLCRIHFIVWNVIFILILQTLIICVSIVWYTWNGLARNTWGINVFIMQIDYVKISCKEDVHICHTNFAKKMERNLHETTSLWKTYGKWLFSKDLEGRDVRCNTWKHMENDYFPRTLKVEMCVATLGYGVMDQIGTRPSPKRDIWMEGRGWDEEIRFIMHMIHILGTVWKENDYWYCSLWEASSLFRCSSSFSKLPSPFHPIYVMSWNMRVLVFFDLIVVEHNGSSMWQPFPIIWSFHPYNPSWKLRQCACEA